MMYKDLHNEIFAKTECLTKEQIEKLLANKLSDKELYTIEKHLIDCPVCSEAVEGYLAHPVTITPTQLDELIDKKTTTYKKNHTKSYLLIAASVAILLGIARIGINHLPTQKKELSLQQSETPETKPKNEFTPLNQPAETVQKNISANTQTPKEAGIETKDKLTNTTTTPKELKEKTPEPELNTPCITDNESAEETILSKQEEFFDEQTSAEAPISTPRPAEITSLQQSKSTKNAGKKKTASRNSKYEQKTLYVKGFKIYDYTLEYAQKEKAKKLAESLSVSPAKENAEDETALPDSLMIHKTTYVELLENALDNLQQKNFQKAIFQFSTIEQKEPHDVNALFYKGIAYEEKGNWQKALKYFDKTLNEKIDIFHDEAKFHKAKTLIALNEKKKAEKLLKKIINEHSFYANQAQKLLKSIKDE